MCNPVGVGGAEPELPFAGTDETQVDLFVLESHVRGGEPFVELGSASGSRDAVYACNRRNQFFHSRPDESRFTVPHNL